MFRSLFLTTALVGITGVSMTQDAHATGTYTAPMGGTVTLDAQPMLGSVYDTAGPVYEPVSENYETLGGQYGVIAPAPMADTAVHTGYTGHAGHAVTTHTEQSYTVAPAPAPSTTQTYTIAPGNSQTYTVPPGQNATYNIVVPTPAPAPVVSYAQPQTHVAPQAAGWAARGVYIGARGGITRNRDTAFTIKGLKGKPANRIKTGYDKGYTGAAVIGYGVRQAHGWGYRVELEGGYQSAAVDTHVVQGVKFSGDKARGDAKTLYGFVNAYADLPVTQHLSLTAGGGVGVGKIKFDGYGVKGRGEALDDSATALGYHLDAGVVYQVSDKVALEALYRYQSFVDAEIRTENGNDQKIDLDSHSVLAGVRVGF